MDNQEPTTASRYTWKERALVAVPLFLLVVGALVACGGGSTSPNVTASSAEEMKTAQAVSGNSTAVVPPGWTGRAPKMEVINGITVPPEPAPSINNATLAGVDVNNNGVRDDVERVLARKFGGGADFPAMLSYARETQLMLTSPTPKTREEAIATMSKIMCATATLLDESQTFGMAAITVNTNARIQARSDLDRKSTRLNSSHERLSRMPSSA